MNQKERIEWLDHHGDPIGSAVWRNKSEIIEQSNADVVVESTGEVIYEDRKKVIIASEKRLDADLSQPLYRAYTNIYKKLILHREKL